MSVWYKMCIHAQTRAAMLFKDYDLKLQTLKYQG